MITQITRPFDTTFSSQLAGKLYLFSRRSLWRYLLGALLLSLARPELLHGFWPTLLALSGGLATLGLAVVVLSSYTQRWHPLTGALVTFRATGLEVQPANGAPPEMHDWQWVLRANETSQRFFLVVQRFPQLVLHLDKHRLTAEEVAALRTWLSASKTNQLWAGHALVLARYAGLQRLDGVLNNGIHRGLAAGRVFPQKGGERVALQDSFLVKNPAFHLP